MKSTFDDKYLYMGIDPGKSGGIAFVSSDYYEAYKMPSTEHDISELIEEFSDKVIKCYIEKVASRPAQSSVATFTFGMNYGMLRALLVAFKIPFDEVTPKKWQKLLGCLSGGDKNVTKAKAQQLFPEIKVTHAIADSLLIAEYCRREK